MKADLTFYDYRYVFNPNKWRELPFEGSALVQDSFEIIPTHAAKDQELDEKETFQLHCKGKKLYKLLIKAIILNDGSLLELIRTGQYLAVEIHNFMAAIKSEPVKFEFQCAARGIQGRHEGYSLLVSGFCEFSKDQKTLILLDSKKDNDPQKLKTHLFSPSVNAAYSQRMRTQQQKYPGLMTMLADGVSRVATLICPVISGCLFSTPKMSSVPQVWTNGNVLNGKQPVSTHTKRA